MRYKLLLPILLFMLSCSLITGLDPSSSSPVTIDLDSPADPVNVIVKLNEGETTSALIPPEGGELTLTSADGSLYTLEVPAGALDGEIEISMTTIGSLEGGPVESNVYGVQLEPSGLTFNELLTLTIQPAAEIPLEEQLMFKYEGSGSDFHRALIDPDSREVRILLTGFSGGGVGQITTTGPAKWEMGRATSSVARIENAIGEQQAQERAGKITKEQAQESIDELIGKAEKAANAAEEAALEDCKELGTAIKIRQTSDQIVDNLAPDDYLQDPLSKQAEALRKCGTYQATGTWEDTILSGVIKIKEPFTLNASSNFCTGSMQFLGSGMSGPVVCDISCLGINFSGNGTFNIKLLGDTGSIKGSCSSLSDIPGDETDIDSFDVILRRIYK